MLLLNLATTNQAKKWVALNSGPPGILRFKGGCSYTLPMTRLVCSNEDMGYATVKYISESFVKPNIQSVNKIKPYILSPWDLRLLSVHYLQIGLLFTKPPTQTFSFDELVETLKHSLAHTLVHFYPLAGQLTTKLDQDQRKCVVLVDYNKGPGVQFLQATLAMSVSDILSPTYIPQVVYSLFDHQGGVVSFDGRSRPLLSVQVTELVDGVFIGCSINHSIVDGVSFDLFWKMWPEIYSAIIRPQSPVLRPPVIGDRSCEYAFPYTFHPDEFVSRYKSPSEMKARIFHFSMDSMRWIKNKAIKDLSTNNITITSFQALAALVWRAVVRAMGLSPHEVTHCSFSINVRNRLEPPLPQEYFGNVIDDVVATTTVDELHRHNIGWVASLLHDSVLNYDNKSATEFVNHWLEAPSFVDYNEMAALRWVRIGGSPTFDRYSHKFGCLGAPVATRFGIGNNCPGKVFMSKAYEGGASVDVEICLMPENMVTLESDREFMDLVTFPNSRLCRSKI